MARILSTLVATALLLLVGRANAACPSPVVCPVSTNPWNGSETDPNAWPTNVAVPPFSQKNPVAGFGSAPYVAAQSSSAVAVNWISHAQCQSGALTYTKDFPPAFPSPAVLQSRNDSELQAGAIRHSVMLEGLDSGTRYYYRAAMCDPSGTALGYMDGTFTTPEPPASVGVRQKRMAFFGEFHADYRLGVSDEFSEAIRSFLPDYIVDSGDMTTNMAVRSLDAYLRQSQMWIPNVALLPTYSNHNVWNYAGTGVKFPNFFSLPDQNGCSGCGTEKTCTIGRPAVYEPGICLAPMDPEDQCPPPNLIEPGGHKPWYSTRDGQVLVITLAGTTTRISRCEREEQLRWLAREIHDAHDPAKDPPKFVIVATHQPLTRADLKSADAYFVETILANGGADLLVVGHLARCDIVD